MPYCIVVWKKLDGSLYYRIDNRNWHHREVCQTNGYGHEIVLIIDLFINPKLPLKKRLIDRAIYLLEKIKE